MSIQLLIIILYLVLTIAIGFFSGRKKGKEGSSSASFHGAGLGIVMCVAAGAGEWLGGTSTSGVSEYGYLSGISGAWYTISNGIGIIVLAIFFAKLYRSLDSITIPGIIEKFLGVNARVVSSILLTFVMLAVGTAQILAAGTLGVTILHLSFNASVIILGIGFIAYTLVGGMKAVATTNILHLTMHYFGVILALLAVSGKLGGLHVIATELPADPYFNWFGIGNSKVVSWLIASVLGACTAQAGIQPLLAAKDVHVARKAAFITGLIVAPYGILTALLGMYAKVQFPDLANAKLAIPSLMMSLSPVVGGIMLAALMSAVMSTISPIILSTGTMLTKDIYQRILRPEASDRKVLLVSRILTGLAGVVCILLAMIFYNSSTILDMVYFAYTIRGSIFVVLLFGIYWKKTSSKGAIWSLVVTALVGMSWVVYHSITKTYPISAGFNETYASIITAVICTITFSLAFPKKKGPNVSVSLASEAE
ncbi:MAG: sodium:solute symporter family protein [Clostridiales bacterium]|nr:sodium:solute symporter family protein [Clostridiales bacterium]